jgi:exopolysaccharide biosynthesis predicted pyruvyltransferase EpsI
MFIVEVGINAYEVAYADGTFTAKSQQPDGKPFEDGVIALAEMAYFEAQKNAEYMPSVEMIEFYTAQEMGIEMEQPEMESEPDFIY